MKKQHGILTLLFSLTALILFAPMVQQNCTPFKFRILVGYKEPTEKPMLEFDNVLCGAYQRQSEAYLQEHFGFREPLIRMYNQCVYDLFKTTSNNDVAIEKDGWLYHTETVYQYFGNMEQKFDKNSDQVRELLTDEARCLAKVNAILKEYGVHFMAFTLPSKSFVYPEHLGWHPVGDTAFNAIDFYERLLEERDIPYINMTSWFKQMQDTCSIDLFYSKGSHWASGAVLAVDTLLRYMEQLGDVQLTKIQRGTPYYMYDISNDDKDLENLLNLARPLKHEYIYEYPVTLISDDNTSYPTVWFIGTSFYWYMKRRVSFDAVFRSRDFTFYMIQYFTNREQDMLSMDDIDMLHELLLHDYVVFFRDGPQLHTYGYLFPGKALISLCISDERFQEKYKQVSDSIGDPWLALDMVQKNPEKYFEELQGDEVPSCRNPRLESVLTEKMIRADRKWNFLLNAKAANDSINAQELFNEEAYNVLNDIDLLRNDVFFTTYDYFNFLLEECPNSNLETRVRQHEFDDDSLMMAACAMDAMVRWVGSESIFSGVRAKAAAHNVSIDKMFRDDVVWCFKELDDWKQFAGHDAIVKAFEYFKIEHQLRLDEEVMSSINQKRIEENLPARMIMNSHVEWCYQNKTQ